MKRRDVITMLGGAAGGDACAQPARMRRIGVLMGLAESDPEGQSRIAALRKIWVGRRDATSGWAITGLRATLSARMRWQKNW
jgi:hypothetical protein